eukprot:COSAG04_NODE_76_length_28498_cov_7.756294_16_plen_223_part_00
MSRAAGGAQYIVRPEAYDNEEEQAEHNAMRARPTSGLDGAPDWDVYIEEETPVEPQVYHEQLHPHEQLAAAAAAAADAADAADAAAARSTTKRSRDAGDAADDAAEPGAKRVRQCVQVGVTVPEGVRGGDTVAIRVGQDHHDAVVPDGLTPGMRFEISLEVDAADVQPLIASASADVAQRTESGENETNMNTSLGELSTDGGDPPSLPPPPSPLARSLTQSR